MDEPERPSIKVDDGVSRVNVDKCQEGRTGSIPKGGIIKEIMRVMRNVNCV